MNQLGSRNKITHLAEFWVAIVMISSFLCFLRPAQSFSQTAASDTLTIRRPESIDDATWQRLLSGFENEKQGFADLLLSLDAKRVDYTKDSLLEVIQKQQSIQKLLSDFQMETVREMAQIDLILNYVFMRNETSPRLSGRVIDVGPKQQIASLGEALNQAISGDCIRLGNGVFEIGGNAKFQQPDETPTDIAIIGQGRDATEIKMNRSGQIRTAVRWRIANVTIDCSDNEVIYIRSGGSFEFFNCKIFNYNSGAGGSNAIGGNNLAIVVENSEMEGDTGRASGRSGGDAFGLRGPNLLYARKVHFEDNSEVIRATFPCVFDRCTAKGTEHNDNNLHPYPGGTVLLKDNQVPVRNANNISDFEYGVDESEFVNLVLGNREKLDARSEQIVKTLQLKRHPAYWIGLLRHNDSEIRRLAGKQVEAILPVKVKMPKPEAVVPNEQVELAIKQLDDPEFEARNTAAKRLQQFGKLAQVELEEAARSGSVEQRVRARRILDQLSVDPNVDAEIECGRLLNWYEQNRIKLKWNESAGTYQLTK